MVASRRLPAEVRKKEIRDAAKKIFLKKGFRNTTMEDVIHEVGMSKGGVYRHYKSTTDMLHDLMLDGNANRYAMFQNELDSFNTSDANIDEAIVQIITLKMLDKNHYKSLYAMFLMEATRDEKLNTLKNQMFEKGKVEYLDFIKKNNLSELEYFASDEWIAFSNSIIVATEVLDVRDVLMKDKSLFTDFIKYHISKHKKPVL